MAQQLAEIQTKYGGKWILDRSEKFEEFLIEMGWNDEDFRKKMVDAKLTNDITVEGDNIKIFTDAGFDSRTEIFKLGEPYEVENHLQEKGLHAATYEDGKLVTRQSPSSKIKIPRTVRHIVDGEMIFELHGDNIVSKRFFKRN